MTDANHAYRCACGNPKQPWKDACWQCHDRAKYRAPSPKLACRRGDHSRCRHHAVIEV